jgi:hypothetical protein
MSELVTKSVAQEQQEQKIETRTAVERIAGFTQCSTTMQHRTSSRPIPKASQTAETRAIRP